MTAPDPIAHLIGDGDRPENWTAEREAAMLADVPGTQPAALTAEQAARLVHALRAMDLQQQQTDNRGQRELAWYYWVGDVERLLGLDEGALDMSSWVDRLEQPS